MPTVDLGWLSDQAKSIHEVFHALFYTLATTLLLIGVIIEYFKLPLGEVPAFRQILGRVFIAALLLSSYAEVTNTIADITDAITKQIGNFSQIHLVLGKMAEKFNGLTYSWTSVKDFSIWVVSFFTFFVLYIAVYLADAGIIFVWTLLYIFSPLLIVLYILPQTASATKALYRSLLEVSAWKIIWATLSTLLWSFAVSEINKPDSNVNFVTVLALNLMLAASLLMTPKIVSALAGMGLSGMAAPMTGMATAAGMFNPGQLLKKGGSLATTATGGAVAASTKMIRREFGNQAARSSRLKAHSPRPPTDPGSPPEWMNQVPPPDAPPHWIQKRLDRENARKPPHNKPLK